jgi:hypothetical protein
MNLLTRLRDLSNSSHSQSWVSVEVHELKALLDVVEAVKYCDANIQTIGKGFDARNVYVVEPKQMVAIGKALVALDGETNGT